MQNYWAMELEPLGSFHNQLMGWGTTHCTADVYDVFVRAPIYQWRAEDAITYAKAIGWGFDIVYPRHRLMQKMSYADNFKWKGEYKPPEDEENY